MQDPRFSIYSLQKEEKREETSAFSQLGIWDAIFLIPKKCTKKLLKVRIKFF